MAKTSQPNRKSLNSKPWWDQELKDAVTRVNVARREHHNYQQWTGEYNPQTQAKICQSRNYFKRLCIYKKRDWINKTLEDATAKDIWKLPNWSKGIRHYPTPPISQGLNLPKATTLHDKCEALRKELYQPPPELDHQFNPNMTVQANDDLPFETLTKEEVHDAIHKNSTNTTPGHSQITYQVLK